MCVIVLSNETSGGSFGLLRVWECGYSFTIKGTHSFCSAFSFERIWFKSQSDYTVGGKKNKEGYKNNFRK